MSSDAVVVVRSALRRYFGSLVYREPTDVARAKVEWRMSCFQAGLAYADYIERHLFTLTGKSVLDTACAWGGHALAFAVRGAQVTGAEINDHEFVRLSKFCESQHLQLNLCRSDCEQLPFVAESFDVILALELIEHISSVDRFAGEVVRLLRPGGVCLLSTPARVRSLIEGEPHYGLKGLTLLPFRLQGWVARRLFGRSYPYPIARQYSRASQVIEAFRAHGLEGRPILVGRLANRLASGSLGRRIAEEYVWSFLIIHRLQ